MALLLVFIPKQGQRHTRFGEFTMNVRIVRLLPAFVIGIVTVGVEHFCQVVVRHTGIERPADAFLLSFAKHFAHFVTAAVNGTCNAADRMVEAFQPQNFPIIDQDYRLQ